MWKYKYHISLTILLLNIDRRKHQTDFKHRNTPMDIYLNASIKITFTDAHKHTHTHTHTRPYIIRVKEENKLCNFAVYSCHQFTITFSLYIPIIFYLHPDQQISHYGQLLKSRALKGWYSASQNGGINFPTIQHKKFMCSVTLYWGKYFLLTC